MKHIILLMKLHCIIIYIGGSRLFSRCIGILHSNPITYDLSDSISAFSYTVTGDSISVFQFLVIL